MASSSSSLSLPLQLVRTGTYSSPIGFRALYRPSPSTRLRLPAARGLRPVAAVSYNDEAAGHGGDAIAAATSVLLRQVDGNAVAAELRAARTPGRRGPQAPKGRPAGKPKESGGGNGGKIHAVPAASLRKPKEGSGGQGGSTN